MEKSTIMFVIVGIVAIVALGVLYTGKGDTQQVVSGPALVVSAPASAQVGESVKVDVMLTQVQGFHGGQFHLQYNPAVLRYERAEEGEFVKQNGVQTMFLPTIKAEGNLVKDVAMIRMQKPGATGDGVVASVYFTVIAPGTSQFELQNVLFLNDQEQQVTLAQQGDTLQVN